MHIAGASTGVVRGHHIYKMYGLHALMETMQVQENTMQQT